MEERLKLSHDCTAMEVDATECQCLVGSARYLTHTWLDLAFTVGYVSHFMQRPKAKHLQPVKRIACYVAGSIDYGLFYSRCLGMAHFVGYNDSNHASDIDTSKSMGRSSFFLGKWLIRWQSLKQ